jgi:hypothetical protein
LRLVDPADKPDCAGFAAALGEFLNQVVKSGMPRWPSDPTATEVPLIR